MESVSNSNTLQTISGLRWQMPAIWAFVHNRPEEHPRISKQELDYIKAGMEEEDPPTTPVWQGFRSFFSKGSYWDAGRHYQQHGRFRSVELVADLFHGRQRIAFFQPHLGHIHPLFPVPGGHHALVLCGRQNQQAGLSGRPGFFRRRCISLVTTIVLQVIAPN